MPSRHSAQQTSAVTGLEAEQGAPGSMVDQHSICILHAHSALKQPHVMPLCRAHELQQHGSSVFAERNLSALPHCRETGPGKRPGTPTNRPGTPNSTASEAANALWRSVAMQQLGDYQSYPFGEHADWQQQLSNHTCSSVGWCVSSTCQHTLVACSRLLSAQRESTRSCKFQQSTSIICLPSMIFTRCTFFLQPMCMGLKLAMRKSTTAQDAGRSWSQCWEAATVRAYTWRQQQQQGR
jgi:hypothetical protein